MNKKTKRGIILTSLASIAFAGSLLAGSTYALFTSESTTNIAVTSGKVDVKATIEDLSVYSPTGINADTGEITGTDNAADTTTNTFKNGGTAKIDGNILTLSNVTPGDKVEFKIKIQNKSNVAVNYRTKAYYVEDNGLSEALKIYIGEQTFNRKIGTTYAPLAVNSEDITVPVTVEMPSNTGSEYQDLSCKISYIVEAIQGNAVTSYDTYPYVYPAGVTTTSFGDNTLAYVDSSGDVKYSSSFETLVKDTSVSTIYCKAGSNFTGINAHPNVDRDLTIYGNNSNFNNADIAIQYTEGNTEGNTANATNMNINIYDTINLRIWGAAIKTNVTLNVYMEGCTVTGNYGQDDNLLYTKGNEEKDKYQGTLNATFKYCKAVKVRFLCSTSSAGDSTFESCVFRDCWMGVKTKLKSKRGATRTDTIKNCLFVNCGYYNENDEKNKYCAPISYSNDYATEQFNGKLTLNSINNKFYKSIGENGDILLGDNRDDEIFNSMTLNLESKDEVTVRTAHDKITTYSSGKNTITCPERKSAS